MLTLLLQLCPSDPSGELIGVNCSGQPLDYHVRFVWLLRVYSLSTAITVFLFSVAHPDIQTDETSFRKHACGPTQISLRLHLCLCQFLFSL